MSRPHLTPTIPLRSNLSSKSLHPFQRLRLIVKSGKAFQSLSGPSARLLMAYLIHVDNKTGLCWPGLKLLAELTGIDETNIARERRKLIELGFIEIAKRGTKKRSATVRLLHFAPQDANGKIVTEDYSNQKIVTEDYSINASIVTGDDITTDENETAKERNPNSPRKREGGRIFNSFEREDTSDRWKFPPDYHAAIVQAYKLIGVKSPHLIESFIREYPHLAPLYAVRLTRKRYKLKCKKGFGNIAAAYLSDPYGKKLNSRSEETEMFGRWLEPDLAWYRDESTESMGPGMFRYLLDKVYNPTVKREDYPDDDIPDIEDYDE